MKHLVRFALLSAAVASCTAIASATTIDSTGGVAGTVKYDGYSATVDTLVTNAAPASTSPLPNAAPWHNALGGSTWVSFEAGTQPGGPNDGGNPNPHAPNGTYTYQITIDGGTTGGTLTGLQVLADDTTSLYLNGIGVGNLIAPSASGSGTMGTCTTGQPNCTAVDMSFGTINLHSGANILYFGVDQIYGSATGLDFEGTFTAAAATPEPGSLALLGTTLIGAAGAFRRRLRA